MTTQTATRFPAGTVFITDAGQATLRRVEFAQIKWTWDLLQLDLDGPVIDGAAIADSYSDLTQACVAATELNRRAKAAGERVVFLVQRHPEPELAAAIEF
jgi:hypothetical protein